MSESFLTAVKKLFHICRKASYPLLFIEKYILFRIWKGLFAFSRTNHQLCRGLFVL